MISLKRREAGDTIVEVLIAITVVATVLAGAYVASRHSLNDTLSAQEHTIALGMAQSQLEQINALANARNTRIFTTTTFHMQNGTCTPNPCNNGSMTVKNAGVGVDYTVVVTPTNTGNQYFYTASVVWPNANGTGNDQVLLSYKVNKP